MGPQNPTQRDVLNNNQAEGRRQRQPTQREILNNDGVRLVREGGRRQQT